MRIGSLFTGSGQLDRAVEAVFGGPILFHVESDPAAAAVLRARWPQILNLGDIRHVDWAVEVWHRWGAGVDILVGGFPCADISCAAAGRRAGLAPGTRSGLWSHMVTAIDELKPALVVIENVRGLTYAHAHRSLGPGEPALADRPARPDLRAAGAVLGDLAALGFDARWVTVSAASVGACHLRERIFILAAADGQWPRRRAALARKNFTSARRNGRNVLTCDDLVEPKISSAIPLLEVVPIPDDMLLPTPTASDASGGGAVPERRVGHGQQMIDFALLHGTKRWTRYEPAIAQWEQLTRPAPPVTDDTNRGNRKLNPAFSEWMLGWPPGWVTGVDGMQQRDALRIIGNGCVPQQAEAALRQLIEVSE